MDFSRHSDKDLMECHRNVDKAAYPANYQSILAEMERRGLSPDPGPGAGMKGILDFPGGPEFSAERLLGLIRGEGGGGFNPAYLFFISLLLFSLAGALSSDREYLYLAVPVLFLHECGHLMAMRLFKYKNTRILFIPFLGALTSGIPERSGRAKEAMVSLAGPWFGTLWGLVFLAAFKFQRNAVWIELASYSFIINGLNLLPCPPLDGGRVVESLVTSRHPILDIGYRAVGAAAFAVGAIHFGDYVLGMMGYFSVIAVMAAFFESRAIRSLRAGGASMDGELTVENVGIIFQAIKASYPDITLDRLRPKTAARLVNGIYLKLRRAGGEWWASAGLLAAYLLSLAVAAVLAAAAVYLKKRTLFP